MPGYTGHVHFTKTSTSAAQTRPDLWCSTSKKSHRYVYITCIKVLL